MSQNIPFNLFKKIPRVWGGSRSELEEIKNSGATVVVVSSDWLKERIEYWEKKAEQNKKDGIGDSEKSANS
jgi:hypothetical protein